jgi:hypothetical protein
MVSMGAISHPVGRGSKGDENIGTQRLQSFWIALVSDHVLKSITLYQANKLHQGRNVMRRRPLRRTKLKVDQVTPVDGSATREALAWVALIVRLCCKNNEEIK